MRPKKHILKAAADEAAAHLCYQDLALAARRQPLFLKQSFKKSG